jgi:hypothetical protein
MPVDTGTRTTRALCDETLVKPSPASPSRATQRSQLEVRTRATSLPNSDVSEAPHQLLRHGECAATSAAAYFRKDVPTCTHAYELSDAVDTCKFITFFKTVCTCDGQASSCVCTDVQGRQQLLLFLHLQSRSRLICRAIHDRTVDPSTFAYSKTIAWSEAAAGALL